MYQKSRIEATETTNSKACPITGAGEYQLPSKGFLILCSFHDQCGWFERHMVYRSVRYDLYTSKVVIYHALPNNVLVLIMPYRFCDST